MGVMTWERRGRETAGAMMKRRVGVPHSMGRKLPREDVGQPQAHRARPGSWRSAVGTSL